MSERRANPPLPEWVPSDATGFQKMAQSLAEVAIITGILIRAFRAAVLTHGAPDNLLYLGGAFTIGAVFLFTALTIHLSRVPLSQWFWRVPTFAVLETIAEMAVSALLISLGREPLGSTRAEMHDWPGIALTVLITRLAVLAVYALLLGLIVQRMRKRSLLRDRTRSEVVRSEIARTVVRE